MKAKKLGLVYAGYGKWKIPNGPTVAKTVGDKLVKLDLDTPAKKKKMPKKATPKKMPKKATPKKKSKKITSKGTTGGLAAAQSDPELSKYIDVKGNTYPNVKDFISAQFPSLAAVLAHGKGPQRKDYINRIETSIRGAVKYGNTYDLKYDIKYMIQKVDPLMPVTKKANKIIKTYGRAQIGKNHSLVFRKVTLKNKNIPTDKLLDVLKLASQNWRIGESDAEKTLKFLSGVGGVVGQTTESIDSDNVSAQLRHVPVSQRPAAAKSAKQSVPDAQSQAKTWRSFLPPKILLRLHSYQRDWQEDSQYDAGPTARKKRNRFE